MSTAMFSGWIMPQGEVIQAKEPVGPFEIEIREHRTPQGSKRYRAYLKATGQRVGRSQGTQKKAQAVIAGMFRKCERPWSDPGPA